MNKPKLNLIEQFIAIFSPKKAIERYQTRMMFLRNYDAAKQYTHSSLAHARRNESEVFSRQKNRLHFAAEDLVRNSPWVSKIISLYSNNLIAYGWGESTQHPKNWTHFKRNLYRQGFFQLQKDLISDLVIYGEAFFLKQTNKDYTVSLTRIHPSSVSTQNDTTGNIINGIRFDKSGNIIGYILVSSDGEREVKAEQVIHVFRKTLPEQVRGISILTPAVHSIKFLDELNYTMLVRHKLSASLTGVVYRSESLSLTPEDDFDFNLSPGTFSKLAPGEKIEMLQVPTASAEYQKLVETTLREVAAAVSVSYESLTGDWSNNNYSSSRAAHIIEKRNYESWQYGLLMPFFDQITNLFELYLLTKGIRPQSQPVTFTPPAIPLAHPKEEVEYYMKLVRGGFITLKQAQQELYGTDFEKFLKEKEQENKLLDQHGVILDTDSRQVSAAGQLQIKQSKEK
jgi:lambda family phage portal protein